MLGSGNGHNWWCLAYPSLCFIDASYDYVPKDSDIYRLRIGTIKQGTLERLFYGKEIVRPLPKDVLSEYSRLFPVKEKEITLHFGFKLWELMKSH